MPQHWLCAEASVGFHRGFQVTQQIFSFEEQAEAEEFGGISPRPYQRQAINGAFDAYDKGSRGVLCRLPTGTGKTITAGLVAKRWIERSEQNRVLVLAHERELVWQFAQELHDVLGEPPRIEMGNRSVGRYETARSYVASRQTLQERNVGGETASRLYKFDPSCNWLVIVDECHRWSHTLKSCRHIFDWFGANPNSWRFGITATPYRTDNVSLEKLFPSVVVDYRLMALDGEPCAVVDGWAVPYKQFFVRVEDVDFTKLETVAGDWKDDELEKVLMEQRRLASLIEPTLDIVGDRRTLIFSPGVEMAKQVALYINAKFGSVVAQHLDGSVQDFVRRDVYRQHKSGQFQFLSVCGLCREGYNDPGIGAVAIYRPTKSRSLAEQMKGRGCRPLKGTVDGLPTAEARREAIAASRKPDCLVVDLVGVTGLADAASTAQIYAESLPGEVAPEILTRANQKLLEGETANVEEAVRKSRDEVLAEREAARLKREEEERRAREEFERRLSLGARAKYSAREVKQGGGGRVINRGGQIVRMASPKQIALLRARGVRCDPEIVTMRMASRAIGQLMKGMSAQQVQAVNRLYKRKVVTEEMDGGS